MLGDQLAQILAVERSGSDFTKFASRLSLLVDSFEIDLNGLGYNNLIFMAVFLSELAKNADSAYRNLIVEAAEAFDLFTLALRSLISFMRPFVQMPRGFCHLSTSAAVVDYRTH